MQHLCGTLFASYANRGLVREMGCGSGFDTVQCGTGGYGEACRDFQEGFGCAAVARLIRIAEAPVDAV